MSSELIAGFVAAAISLALEVVPGLRDLWGGVASKYKPLVVLALCLVVPLVGIALACARIDIGLGAVCPPVSDAGQAIAGALELGVVAFVSSQVVHSQIGSGLAISRRFNEEQERYEEGQKPVG